MANLKRTSINIASLNDTNKMRLTEDLRERITSDLKGGHPEVQDCTFSGGCNGYVDASNLKDMLDQRRLTDSQLIAIKTVVDLQKEPITIASLNDTDKIKLTNNLKESIISDLKGGHPEVQDCTFSGGCNGYIDTGIPQLEEMLENNKLTDSQLIAIKTVIDLQRK